MTIDAIETLVESHQLRLRWAGMTSFWGYLAGMSAVIVVCRANRLPLARLADLAAAPMGLALFCARLGCFLAGCDYGKVTSVPWAVRFPKGSPAWRDQLTAGLLPPERAESLPVHPTQLYEAALGLLMFGVALVLLRRMRDGKGRVFLACAALYAVGRLAIETVRGDAGRGIYAGLSSGQIFSIVALVAVALTWLASHRRAMLGAIAAAALALALFDPHTAEAQPAPTPIAQPQPQPQPQQQPYPQQPPPPQPQADAPIRIGLLAGIEVPINRRADQVPALSGGTVSAGYGIGHIGVWLDYDSYNSSEAHHTTGLVSGSFTQTFGKWSFGGRLGFGATSVTFKDMSFSGATGPVVRLEGTADYRLGTSWTVWARLTPFDVLSSTELGGPIVTYQMRIGLAYRFGGGSAAPQPQPQPLQPQPPQPQPLQPQPLQPPPQPLPPQPQQPRSQP
jgi:prolipoprotein diacylglyceryltransferase